MGAFKHIAIDRHNRGEQSPHTLTGDTTMISDTQARKIASEWHGGGGTALYAFSSTGAINTARYDHDLDSEIRANILEQECIMRRDHPDDGSNIEQLRDLLVYVQMMGERNPVEGWGKLTW